MTMLTWHIRFGLNVQSKWCMDSGLCWGVSERVCVCHDINVSKRQIFIAPREGKSIFGAPCRKNIGSAFPPSALVRAINTNTDITHSKMFSSMTRSHEAKQQINLLVTDFYFVAFRIQNRISERESSSVWVQLYDITHYSPTQWTHLIISLLQEFYSFLWTVALKGWSFTDYRFSQWMKLFIITFVAQHTFFTTFFKTVKMWLRTRTISGLSVDHGSRNGHVGGIGMYPERWTVHVHKHNVHFPFYVETQTHAAGNVREKLLLICN